MDKPMKTKNLKSGYNFEDSKLELSVADATGYWFAAAVLFAFLAAGVIVYRTANSDVQTASNDVPGAAQSSPIEAPPILPPR
jgi:hypothetical protein